MNIGDGTFKILSKWFKVFLYLKKIRNIKFKYFNKIGNF